jgi:hypothetical protein
MLKAGKIKLRDKKTMSVLLVFGTLLILGAVIFQTMLQGAVKEVQVTVIDANGNRVDSAELHLVVPILSPDYEETQFTSSTGKRTFYLSEECDDYGVCIMCGDSYTLGVSKYYLDENGDQKKSYKQYKGYVCTNVAITIQLDWDGSGGGTVTTTTTPPTLCTDSDGGKVKTIKGKTYPMGTGLYYSDTCHTDTIVKEFYCGSSGYDFVFLPCDSNQICDDGRCIVYSTTSTTKTTTTTIKTTSTTKTTTTTIPPSCDDGDILDYTCSNGKVIEDYCVCVDGDFVCMSKTEIEEKCEGGGTEELSLIVIGIAILLVAVYIYRQKK